MSYSISKKPLIGKMYKELGEELVELIGKSTKSIMKDLDNAIKEAEEYNNAYMQQTSYFLSLNPDTVKKLKSFVKTKAYKINPENAIMDKIDKLEEAEFLSDLFEIILNK